MYVPTSAVLSKMEKMIREGGWFGNEPMMVLGNEPIWFVGNEPMMV